MLTALKDNGLELIAQYYHSFESDFNENEQSFRRYMEYYCSEKPYLINTQTGKDYFTFEQNAQLFSLADDLEKKHGVRICHETHRSKALYAAHVSAKYFERLPFLKITADFSHWCCVAESLLADQKEAVNLGCSRALHIHSRVGHREGPQVSDPRASEWTDELNAHLVWWDKIESNAKARSQVLSITTEFGPPPYLPTLPFTRQPVTSQWEINNFMKELLHKRYLMR